VSSDSNRLQFSLAAMLLFITELSVLLALLLAAGVDLGAVLFFHLAAGIHLAMVARRHYMKGAAIPPSNLAVSLRDLTWGVVAPTVFLIWDPILFKERYSSNPLESSLYLYSIPCLAFIAAQVALMLLTVVATPVSDEVKAFLSGGLLAGLLPLALIAALTLPVAILFVAITSLGFAGFLPSFCYCTHHFRWKSLYYPAFDSLGVNPSFWIAFAGLLTFIGLPLCFGAALTFGLEGLDVFRR